MIVALIHLLMFSMFLFLCVLGGSIFLIVQMARKYPASAVYWVDVLKRIVGW